MNHRDTNELKRGGGYLKEKTLVGLSRITGDELNRSIMKATSHMLKAPKEKHIHRLLGATYGYYKSDTKGGKSVSDYIVSELEKRSHTHNWIVVLKTMVTMHCLMSDGSDEVNASIQRNRNIFCVKNIKNLADTTEGALHDDFIRQYMQYLEERALFQSSIGSNGRMETAEFSSYLRSLDVESLAPLFKLLLSQLNALSEVNYREAIVDNSCTLEAYQKLVDDGKILYQLLSNRVVFILDGFNDFALPLKKLWMDMYRFYSVVSEKVRLLFDCMLDSSKVFSRPPPRLKPLPSSLLRHLEDDINMSEIGKEVVTETLEGLGIVESTNEACSDEQNINKETSALPESRVKEETPRQEKEQQTLLLTHPEKVTPLLSVDDLFVSPPPPPPSVDPLSQPGGLDAYLSSDQHLMAASGNQDSSSVPAKDASNNLYGVNTINTDDLFTSDKAINDEWSTGAPPTWQTAFPTEYSFSPPSDSYPNNNWDNTPSNPGGNLEKSKGDPFKDLYTEEHKGWHLKE